MGIPPRPRTNYTRAVSEQVNDTNKLLHELLKALKETPMVCKDAPIDPFWKPNPEIIQRQRIYNLQTKVNELTNMLCALGQEVEKIDSKILTHKLPDVGNWYYLHKRQDALREEQEKEKQLEIIHKKRMIEDLKKEIEDLSKD
jgi:hypothetical protein